MAIEKITDNQFHGIPVEVYANNGEDILISSLDLAAALGVTNSAIRNMVFRNDYLDDPEFSFRADLRGHPRVFTEDGVYEILMLMEGNEKAKEFRRWLRGIVKGLRNGETKVVNQAGETVVDSDAVGKKLDSLLGAVTTVKQLMAIQEERMDHHDKLFARLNEKLDNMNSGSKNDHMMAELQRQVENSQSLSLTMMQMLQDLLNDSLGDNLDEDALLAEPADLAEWREHIEDRFTELEEFRTYRPYSAVLKMVRDMGVDTEAVVQTVQECAEEEIDALTAIGWSMENRKMLEQAITDYAEIFKPKKAVEKAEVSESGTRAPGFMQEGHKQIWSDLILPLAEMRNDHSVSHCVVYREVYKTMSSTFGVNWDKERECFRNTYGIAPSGIQEMIRKTPRLYDVMEKAVSYMLDNI